MKCSEVIKYQHFIQRMPTTVTLKLYRNSVVLSPQKKTTYGIHMFSYWFWNQKGSTELFISVCLQQRWDKWPDVTQLICQHCITIKTFYLFYRWKAKQGERWLCALSCSCAAFIGTVSIPNIYSLCVYVCLGSRCQLLKATWIGPAHWNVQIKCFEIN